MVIPHLKIELRELSQILTVNDLASFLGSLSSLMAATERAVIGHAAKTTWVIRELHHSVPTIVIDPIQPTPEAAETSKAVIDILAALEAGNSLPRHLTPREEESLHTLIATGAKYAPHFSLNDLESISITTNSLQGLEQLHRQETKEFGTIEGTLELLK